MSLLELYDAYRASRKNSRRSADQVAMEVSLYDRLYELWQKVNARSFTPSKGYSFIHRRPKAREVFAAEVELKILQCHFDGKMRPIIESLLCGRTFNNRVGYGGQRAINRVIEDVCDATEDFTKPAWIIKWDLKGFFPNINQDRACALVKELILANYRGEEADDLLFCSRLSCYCNPSAHGTVRRSQPWEWQEIPSYKSLFRKPDGVGGAIGYLYWQIVTNLYLACIDQWAIDNISRRYVRFVDDSVAVVTDAEKPVALSAFSALRREYAKIGVEMHPRKFQCQRAENGAEFLGYRIKPHRAHCSDKTYGRAMAAAKDRRKPLSRYACSVNSYLGLLKAGTDFAKCCRVLDAASRKGLLLDYTEFKAVPIRHKSARKPRTIIDNRQQTTKIPTLWKQQSTASA